MEGLVTVAQLATVTVVLIAFVALAAVVSSNGGGGSSKASSSDRSTSTTAGGGGTSGGSRGTSSAAADPNGVTDGGISGGTDTVPSAQLPLAATISDTKGLHDGDVVTVTIDADKGSLIYGAEMRMCKAGTQIQDDGEMLPTVTGWCISKPLSAGADGYKIQAADKPYDHLVATYKVGEGTDTYTMDDGSHASVTCDRDHPCVLAVKYQIPNGFGFRTYPLTFS